MERKYIYSFGLILLLLLLYLLGFHIVKYLLAIFIFSILFEITVSAFCIFLILLIIPFTVYFGFDRFSENLAQAAYIFLIGGILNFIAANSYMKKIFPRFPNKYYIVTGVVYFLVMLILGILKQINKNVF